MHKITWNQRIKDPQHKAEKKIILSNIVLLILFWNLNYVDINRKKNSVGTFSQHRKKFLLPFFPTLTIFSMIIREGINLCNRKKSKDMG